MNSLAIQFRSWLRTLQKTPQTFHTALSLFLLTALFFPSLGTAQTTPTYGLRVVVSSGLGGPTSVAVDKNGNLYATDPAMQRVDEFLAVNGIVPSNPAVRTIGSGFFAPESLVLDAAGDLYVADLGPTADAGSIKEVLAVNGSIPDNPAILTLVSNLSSVYELSRDANGNLFLGSEEDDDSDAVLQVVAVNGSIPANPTIRTLYSTQAGHLGFVRADSKGDVFFLAFDAPGYNNTSVFELVATNGVIPDNAMPLPVVVEPDPPSFEKGVIDASGNLFISEIGLPGSGSSFDGAIIEVAAVNGTIPANPTITTLYSADEKSTFFPMAIGLDQKDNIFATNFIENSDFDEIFQIVEIAPVGVTLTPASYDYGSVAVGSSGSQTFTLANTGTASVNIASTSLTSQVFTITDTTCTATLAAASSCTYELQFAPVAAGAQMVTFSVTDDAGTQSATLTGTGMAVTPPAAPAAALTPASEDFGTVTAGSSSAVATFTLTNAGTAPLPITSITLAGANASSFAIGKNGCGSSLAAGASCALNVTFNPTAVGSDTASLSVIDSVGTQTSALTGSGAAVVVPDFAITATPSTQTVAAGSTASYTVNITPSNGFDSAVALSAAGLPSGDTVTFTPASVTPGGAPASSTMAIQTSSSQTVSDNRAFRFAAPLLAAVFFFLPLRRLRRWRAMLCALLFSTTLLVMSGCGGGFGLGTPPKTAATYTVTVTGTSGTLTHSTKVQITVTGE